MSKKKVVLEEKEEENKVPMMTFIAGAENFVFSAKYSEVLVNDTPAIPETYINTGYKAIVLKSHDNSYLPFYFVGRFEYKNDRLAFLLSRIMYCKNITTLNGNKIGDTVASKNLIIKDIKQNYNIKFKDIEKFTKKAFQIFKEDTVLYEEENHDMYWKNIDPENIINHKVTLGTLLYQVTRLLNLFKVETISISGMMFMVIMNTEYLDTYFINDYFYQPSKLKEVLSGKEENEDKSFFGTIKNFMSNIKSKVKGA